MKWDYPELSKWVQCDHKDPYREEESDREEQDREERMETEDGEKGGILVVLKMEEGPQYKKCRVTSVGKSKKTDTPEILKKKWSPIHPFLDFRFVESYNNKFVFWATVFVVILYSSNKKLIQISLLWKLLLIIITIGNLLPTIYRKYDVVVSSLSRCSALSQKHGLYAPLFYYFYSITVIQYYGIYIFLSLTYEFTFKNIFQDGVLLWFLNIFRHYFLSLFQWKTTFFNFSDFSICGTDMFYSSEMCVTCQACRELHLGYLNKLLKPHNKQCKWLFP